jgi:hypothetical protein
MRDTTEDGTHDRATVVLSLVEYLDRYAPAVSASLRNTYPWADGLRPGRKLGDQPVDPERGRAPIQGREVDAFVDLAQKALAAADNRIEANSSALRRRLRQIAHIKLTSSIIAAVSGVGLIGALILDARIATFVGAGVNLLSTVVSLVAQYFDSPVYGESTAPRDIFARMVTMARDLTQLRHRLEVAAAGLDGDAPVLDLVRQANALVAELRTLEMQIGL